jgi:hypothetical protein
MMELKAIEAELLDTVQGGSLANGGYMPNWGETHTILQQGAACASLGLFAGMPLGPKGMAVGAAITGGGCAGTAYMALREQAAAERAKAAQPPAK